MHSDEKQYLHDSDDTHIEDDCDLVCSDLLSTINELEDQIRVLTRVATELVESRKFLASASNIIPVDKIKLQALHELLASPPYSTVSAAWKRNVRAND